MDDMTEQLRSAEQREKLSHGDWDAGLDSNEGRKLESNLEFISRIDNRHDSDNLTAIKIDEYPKWSDQGMHVMPSERQQMTFRLECLKMATLHANAEQVETGAVYKIAEDYYDYIINGKKQKNGNS